VNPRLVLADEPTGALDTATGGQVIELLLGMCAARGAGLLLATHDERLAARCARRIRLVDGAVRR
jgi:putative ABC transport system ATP-binding protein